MTGPGAATALGNRAQENFQEKIGEKVKFKQPAKNSI